MKKFCEKNRLILVLYLGQDGRTCPNFFLFLHRLRNFLGWRFSYIIFASSRLLLHQIHQSQILDKVLRRNIEIVHLLQDHDARVVLSNYEQRYRKKLMLSQRKSVLSGAGGNPGLIKALYLLSIDENKKNSMDIEDDRLRFRLDGIISDVPLSDREKLYGSAIPSGDVPENQLVQFGYLLPQGRAVVPFSPIVSEYLDVLKKSPARTDNPDASEKIGRLLHLTKSQRTMLEYLERRQGELITKDDMAKALWGDAWADKYSDWAIDQLISTLRDKLITIKHSGTIVTKKGEGILFVRKK